MNTCSQKIKQLNTSLIFISLRQSSMKTVIINAEAEAKVEEQNMYYQEV